MAIVCIKIGENEPSSYAKFDRLSKHGDIIEVLPRKRDKGGKIISRTMGQAADKQYFGLNVDMSTLTDDEFNKVRYVLRETWEGEPKADESGILQATKLAKRKRQFDFSKLSNIGISAATKTKIDEKTALKRSKQPFNMMEVNKYNIDVPFENFAKCVKNKATGKILEEELNLKGKKVKACVSGITGWGL